MVASCSFKRDAFEQMFLERFKPQLNGGQYADGLRIVLVALSGELRTEYRRVKVDEFVTVPARLKQRSHALQHIAVASGRYPQIPLQSMHLRRVGKVGRSDVTRRKPIEAMKHPCLGMQTGDRGVIGHTDLCTHTL